MTITKLIERLKELQNNVGDVTVEVRNQDGDFDEASAVETVNVSVSSKRGNVTIWRVYID